MTEIIAVTMAAFMIPAAPLNTIMPKIIRNIANR